MDIKKNCDDWMDYVYECWLEDLARSEHPSYLRESTKNIVERMKKAAHFKKTEEAWNLLERLKRLNEGFDSEARIEKYKYEKPESYMECALTAYELGDLRDAQELFRASIGDFHNSVYKAVCHWMMGCVQWQIPSRSELAVLSWERSLQVMKDFSSENLSYATDLSVKEIQDKCNQAIKDMSDAINKATRYGSPYPPPNVPNIPNETKGKPAAYSARLKFNSLPYHGSIPAGDPVAALKNPDGVIDMDSLEIEDHSYNVFNIKKEGEIQLKPSAEYFLMKVVGNSMNTAKPVKIENDDYVLLKNTRQAQNNDIVAAVVIRKGEPEVATLKRYHVDGSGHFLDSESDKELIHIEMSDGDYVQGVLIAILKPADD